MDINFLTLNVLSSHYTYFNLAKCPPNLTCQTELETIEIRNKRYSKIIHFILSTNPDIGCLQEVEGLFAQKIIEILSNGNKIALEMGIQLSEYDKERKWGISYTYKKNIRNTQTGLLIFYRKNHFIINQNFFKIINENKENTTVYEINTENTKNISFGIDYGLQKFQKKSPDFVQDLEPLYRNPNKWTQIICIQPITQTNKNLIISNVHLEGDPEKKTVRINQLKTILNYYEYLDSKLNGNNHFIISGDWNDEDPIYPLSSMQENVQNTNIIPKLSFLPYFAGLVDTRYYPNPYRFIATSYQINTFNFEKAKKETKKKNTKFNYQNFYSYNDDPWKIIDHIVLSNNTVCQNFYIYPSHPNGVMGLTTPYLSLQEPILGDWPSDHAAIILNILI